MIIFGIPEADETVISSEERINFDVHKITNLHDGVSDDLKINQDEIEKVIRLGKRQQGISGQRPRPICLKFKAHDRKYEMLNAAKQLKGASENVHWKKQVYIVPDYTVKQRLMQKEVVEEFKRRKEEGERMIKNFKIVKVRNFQQVHHRREQD